MDFNISQRNRTPALRRRRQPVLQQVNARHGKVSMIMTSNRDSPNGATSSTILSSQRSCSTGCGPDSKEYRVAGNPFGESAGAKNGHEEHRSTYRRSKFHSRRHSMPPKRCALSDSASSNAPAYCLISVADIPNDSASGRPPSPRRTRTRRRIRTQPRRDHFHFRASFLPAPPSSGGCGPALAMCGLQASSPHCPWPD